MYKVLIADDEPKIGLLVKQLIDWDRLELELADVVRDGKTAYEIILEKRPEIVITDIRMPQISGLDLIRRVCEQGLRTHFIVISGYRYFEYAQKALKFGVEDYLLKPIEEEELNRILEKVCREEEKRLKERERLSQMESRLKSSRYILHREFIEEVMEKKAREEGMTEANRTYGLSFENGAFLCFVLKVDRDLSAARNLRQEKLIEEKLMEIAERELRPLVKDMVLGPQKNLSLSAIINYETPAREQIRSAGQEMFRRIREYIGNFRHYEVTMGISEEADEFSRINMLLAMAREAADNRILEGTGRCIGNDSLGKDAGTTAKDLFASCAEEFRNAIDSAKEEQILVVVGKCFRQARQKGALASEYYQLGREMFLFYLNRLKPGGELFEEEEERLAIWEEGVRNCTAVSMLAAYVAQNVAEDLSRVIGARLEAERRPVQEAMEYIRDHYGEKLLLDDIAARSGFNTNYFCELFKRETGKNFTAYLAGVRMEAAKGLLRDTRETVYEIAEKVGYKDAKFFSRQFAKIVGIKPNEYRKLYH